jgi:putative acyl-CoA dehydrogenase
VAGSPEVREHSRRAERNLPILRTHDRFGNRIDEVELDPSWHWLLRGAIEREIHSLPWREQRPGGHAVRGALFMLWSNANDGVMCPVSMTYAAVAALRDGAPELAAEWEPRLTKPDYDTGALAGMAMTERQGGSDVRANITKAVPLEGDGLYEIHGHKWFCSYPPCDVFLVLAQAPQGLSCFLVERGPGMEFQRLKDKLGTRSLPSSEVEFRGIHGRLVGEEGRGVPAIIRMVNHTRLDCLLGATTGLRRGTLEAIHHARHRTAFGALLADQPAMRNVLADLAVESEAATASAMRVARSYDEPGEAAFRRFATAVMKYWVSKRAPGHAAEALECLGGNGFVEDSGMPLLYRDAPLNSIWEGSGNVAALDVLRAMAKEPEGLPAFLAECELASGADRRLDAHLERARERTTAVFSGEDPQFLARRVVEDLALALQGSLLVRHAPTAVADAFCASRLAGEGGRVYGTLPAGVQAGAIIERALPA